MSTYFSDRASRRPLGTPVRPASTGGTGGAPSGPAGGDLAGTYPNPVIGPGAVGNAEISDVAWAKVTGAPAPVPGPQGPPGPTGPTGPGVAAGGTTGQVLAKTSAVDYATAWATPATIPTTLPPSGPATGDLSGTYPAPQIATGVIVDADVSATAAIQYTKLTGVPTTLPGPPTGAASGSLAGSYPGPTLTTTGVTAGTYGTTAKIPQVTLTAEGRVSAVTELAVAPTGGSPSGAAGGSLAGSYPNPTLATTGVTAGTYGSQYKVAQITLSAEGRVTVVAEITVRARWG